MRFKYPLGNKISTRPWKVNGGKREFRLPPRNREKQKKRTWISASNSSFLGGCPGLVRVVRFHLPGDLRRVRSEVLLINLPLLIDDKGHDP